MKRLLYIFSVVLLASSCIKEEEGIDNVAPYVMCLSSYSYYGSSGYCYPTTGGYCGGYSSEIEAAFYASYSDCQSDLSYTTDYYDNNGGVPTSTPNSVADAGSGGIMGGSGNSSSGSSGNGSSGSGATCNTNTVSYSYSCYGSVISTQVTTSCQSQWQSYYDESCSGNSSTISSRCTSLINCLEDNGCSTTSAESVCAAYQ